MRILKHKDETEVTCDKCGCVFAYESSDVKESTVHWAWGKSEFTTYIRCPECGNVIRAKR